MWKYHQKMDFETSVKISPMCHSWQSVCWLTLKGHELAKFLILDRSVAYQVMLSMVIVAITCLAFRWFWKRRNTIPVSEIQHLRERVQFCNHDMAVLQNTLDTALLSKRATVALVETNVKLTDALQEPEVEPKPKEDSEPEKEAPPETPEVSGTSESETLDEPSSSKAEDSQPKPIPTVHVLGAEAKAPVKEKSAEPEPVKSSIPTRVDNKRKSPSRNSSRPAARDLKETNLARIAGQNQTRNRIRLVKSAPTYRNEKI
ncbi:uncharacterized protein Dana_GF26968 [Drosophila ananassae]|uniref:Uncharacterized protein n=1 Tax=Drosophila ananassae TaxID=7217 RepID=A0A0P9C2S6_DROAN|nr:uncharacterized protein LOC26514377 [Drosophila ananassae]KPU77968.1 uncharacterized protein Dana_GF26968 [Drosophila ananassae]